MARDDQPPTTYQLQIRGRLPSSLSEHLEGFTIQAGPTTTVTGPVADPAALYGLIARLECLGLTLMSVQAIAGSATPPSPVDPAT